MQWPGFTGRAESPIFSRKLNNRECKEGRPVKFECAAKGIPQPEVTWYVNNVHIPLSSVTTFSVIVKYREVIIIFCIYGLHRKNRSVCTQATGGFGILKCTHIVSSWCFLVDWQTKFIKGITLILFSFSIWTFWLLFRLNAWAFVIFPSNFTSFWLLLKVLERSTGWGRPPLPHWYQEELRWCCLQPKHWQHWGRGHWRGQGHRSKQSRRCRHNCQTHCRR